MGFKKMQRDAQREYRKWVAACPLRIWRKEKGVTIAEAAHQVGCSWRIWAAWEAGSYRPQRKALKKNLQKMIGDEIVDQMETWNPKIT